MGPYDARMGRAVLVVVALMGCGADGTSTPPDAASDAAISADAGIRSELDVPIGGACTLLWCAHYEGICDANVCRPLCEVVDFPFCH